MKPKMDPIKPKQSLVKKPNFKKEILEDSSIKLRLGQFRSPGVYTREMDTLRGEEPTGNGRIYNINVGELNDDDVQQFMERMRSSMMIPQQYFGNQETEVVDIQQMRTQQEVVNLWGQLGHPIGISSRQIQNVDGSMDLISYDLVPTPSTRSAHIGGGEQMMYEASTWMTLHKKKSRWERFKAWVSNIYMKWKRAE